MLQMPEIIPEIVIADTSCLIALENINGLDLLWRLYRSVMITPEVAEEFGHPLPDWIVVQNVSDREKLVALNNVLDLGEASALALALEHRDCLLLLDDLKGRKIAEEWNIRYTGVLGILVKAKRARLIPEIKPMLERLLKTNFRISPVIVAEALKIAGECPSLAFPAIFG